MTQVTGLDIARFQAELERGDRAGFYIDYYNVTGSSQALSLAQISSFSGAPGAAASLANAIDALLPNYPSGGVNSFSLAIANSIFQKVVDDVEAGGTGVLSNTAMISTAKQTWASFGIEDEFPGNALPAQSLLESFLTGDRTYFDSHWQDLFTVGGAVGLLSGLDGTLTQAELDNQRSYTDTLNGFAQDVLGMASSAQQIHAPIFTSADGKVSYQLDSSGNVAYGSVRVNGTVFPSTSDDPGLDKIIVKPNADGSFSFSIGPDFEQGSFDFNFDKSGLLADSISYEADGVHTADYDTTGAIKASDIAYATGGELDTTYSTDQSTLWVSQGKIFNTSHQLIGNTEVDRNGSATFSEINPLTGQTILTTTKEADGSIQQKVGPNTDYPKFVEALADTLVSQVITNFLIKNNVPAAIAAQAFATATIHSALTGQTADFGTALANSAFNIAGGIAGSTFGADIAKALGLPVVTGQITGGIVGNELTQLLIKEVSKAIDPDLQLGSDITTKALSTALASSLGSLAGSELASLLLTPTIEGQIAGALGSAAALALLPEAAPFEIVFAAVFGADFVGNLFGDLISSVFGGFPSVGPNASSVSTWNSTTKQFVYKHSYTDNGGKATQVNAMGNALTGAVNSLVAAIGGQLTGPIQDMSLVWIDGKYYFTFGDHYAQRGMVENADPNAVVQQAAIAWLKSLNIKGGNPLMTYVAEHTTATTLAQLASDLTAARDYSLYLSNPVAFDLGIALSNDPTKLTTWQAELARVGQLGLTQLTATDMANLAQFGTEAPWRETNGGWTLTPALTDAQGHAFALPANNTVIGGSTNLLGKGGYDVIWQSGTTLDWTIYEFDRSGKLLGSAVLTQSNKSVGLSIFQSTNHFGQILGTASDVLGAHGPVLLVYEAASAKAPAGIALLQLDPNHAGVVTSSFFLKITNGGNLFTSGNTSPVYFAGRSAQLLGTRGADLVFGADGGPGNVVWVAEMDMNIVGGASSIKELVRPNGSEFFVPGKFEVAGTFQNFMAHPGKDLLLRYDDGTVHDLQLSLTNPATVVSDTKLTYVSGGDFILDSGASITLLRENSELFIRHADQHVSVAQLDASGHIASVADATWLDGSNLILPSGIAPLLVTENLIHPGAEGMIFQYSDGHLAVGEIDASGHFTAMAALTNANHTPFVPDAGSTIAFTTGDALGKAEMDLFVIKANGQFAIDGFDPHGVMVAGGTLMNSGGGTAFTIDPTQTVLGITNEFAANTTDLVVQGAKGALSVSEFNSANDRLIKTVTLTQSNGQPLYLNKTIAIEATGHNLEGKGETDIVVENADHSLSALGFDPNTGKQLSFAANTSAGIGPMELDLAHNVSHDQVWVDKAGTDLVLTVLGSGGNDTFVFKNFDSTPNVTVHTTDGMVIDHAGLLLEAAADASYEISHPDFSAHTATAFPDDPTFKSTHDVHWHLMP